MRKEFLKKSENLKVQYHILLRLCHTCNLSWEQNCWNCGTMSHKQFLFQLRAGPKKCRLHNYINHWKSLEKPAVFCLLDLSESNVKKKCKCKNIRWVRSWLEWLVHAAIGKIVSCKAPCQTQLFTKIVAESRWVFYFSCSKQKTQTKVCDQCFKHYFNEFSEETKTKNYVTTIDVLFVYVSMANLREMIQVIETQ